MGSETPPNAVAMHHIGKSFAGVQALQDVSFAVAPGQISALLGENGAGKSTLMQVLAGLYTADSGFVEIDGARVDIGSPGRAIKLGVGMVHQHFQLVAPFTVAENILLGTSTPRFWLQPKEMYREVLDLCRRCGIPVDPSARVCDLSVAQKQQVEILKVLYRGARILILDEPTAVLGPLEVPTFFQSLRELAQAGTAVILITHKLTEVLQVAQTVTVLRKGRVVGANVQTAGADEEELGRMILGQDETKPEGVGQAATEAKPEGVVQALEKSRSPTLVLSAVGALGFRGEVALDQLDLQVRPGEILAVAGVSGNGQRELCEVIVGLRPPTHGRIELDGLDMTSCGVLQRLQSGLAYIPEDRLGSGVAPGLSVVHNLSLRLYRRGGRLIDWSHLQQSAEQMVLQQKIQLRDIWQPAAQLSGGNVQKLILAREMASQPKVLLAAQPTRGLDLGAALQVRQQLTQLARAGCAVLLVSEDLDELFVLGHRIAVLLRGKIAGVLERKDATVELVGQLMLGRGEG